MNRHASAAAFVAVVVLPVLAGLTFLSQLIVSPPAMAGAAVTGGAMAGDSAYPAESWPVTNEWIDGGISEVITLPPMTSDPSRIVFDLETWNTVRHAWENTNPAEPRLGITAYMKLEHEVFMRDSAGRPRRLGGSVRMIGAYMPFAGDGDLAPYDGVTDNAGPSGYDMQCPGPSCLVPGGAYHANALGFYVWWGPLPEWQKQAFRDGASLLYRATAGYPDDDEQQWWPTNVSWETEHGWWNDSDAKVSAKLTTMLEF